MTSAMAKPLMPRLQQHRMMDGERVLLVDAQDRRLDQEPTTATKREAHKRGGVCMDLTRGVPHRAFSVFLFNNRNELLLQKRAASKLLFPGHWANTCCSHPLADGSVFLGERIEGEEDGEAGVKRAAVRKLAHELGVHVQASQLRMITRVLYRAEFDDEWGEHELDYVLFGRLADGTPVRPNPGEVDVVRWVAHDECRSFLRGGRVSVSPWFDKIARTLLLPRWWSEVSKPGEEDEGWSALVDGRVHDLSAA